MIYDYNISISISIIKCLNKFQYYDIITTIKYYGIYKIIYKNKVLYYYYTYICIIFVT